jgi:hypothetical protein
MVKVVYGGRGDYHKFFKFHKNNKEFMIIPFNNTYGASYGDSFYHDFVKAFKQVVGINKLDPNKEYIISEQDLIRLALEYMAKHKRSKYRFYLKNLIKMLKSGG